GPGRAAPLLLRSHCSSAPAAPLVRQAAPRPRAHGEARPTVHQGFPRGYLPVGEAVTVPGCSGDMRNGITRRSLLTALAAGAGGLLLPDAVVAARPVSRALRRDPFTLGIASGDPTGTGVVLWTRLAPDPTAPDGLGGMPAHDVEVGWQLAADERFSKVVAS